ncbi:MAG TPA: TonB-dependent receptor [Opitutaceae bacterium]
MNAFVRIAPALFAWSLPLAPALFAQGSAAAGDDDTVRLSEFTVNAEPDGSYVASETVTGSRVAEKIKNLPYNVNVITSEFLEDFAFFDLDEDFAYTSSFGNMDAGGGYTIRGFGATKALRNGFQRFGLIDRVNVDRIEVIKGPSAAVYGETRPGGLVNIVTKRPKTKPAYDLSVSVGTNDTFRTDVGATGPLTASKNTAYLFNAAYYERGYEQPFAMLRQKTVSGAISHKFSDRTNLLVEVEYLTRQADNTSQIPMINDSSQPATRRRTRIAEEYADYNFGGPKNNFTDREISSVNATLEHRLSDVWSLRAAANWFNRNYWTFTHGGDNIEVNPASANFGTYGSRSPSAGAIYENGGGFQADALARYFLFDRKLENRTLFTLDYSTYWRVDPQWRLPASGTGSLSDLVSRGLYAQRLDLDAPNYATPDFTLQNFPTINRYRDNRTDITGGFLRHQTAALKGRIIVAGGIRYDIVKFRLTDKKAAVQAGDPALLVTDNYEVTATTPSGGINVGITDNIRTYVNYAKSFFPDSQNVTAGTKAENEGGFGWDYGFKVGLFQDRLNFTLGGFYIERTNVSVTDYDEETGLSITRRIGNTLSRGVELDANWRINDNLSTTFGYSYTTSIYTKYGRDLEVIGRQATRIPEHNAYFTVRYAWKTGRLKGLTANAGFTYTGETYPYSDGGGIVEPATLNGQPNPNRGLILTHDGRRDIRLPGYFATRAGIRYSWRPDGSRFSHTVGINLTNLLDEDYITANRRKVDPFSTSFTYSIRY